MSSATQAYSWLTGPHVPPVISAEEAMRRPSVDYDDYVQDALALEFRTTYDDGAFERQPTVRALLPDPAQHARRIAQSIIEATAGLRPPTQLIRHLAPSVYGTVARRSLLAARRPNPGGRRAVVTAVRVCEPRDGVAEAALVVADGTRARALALRLEGLDGRWLVTDLAVG